jgi:hypothetical protein
MSALHAQRAAALNTASLSTFTKDRRHSHIARRFSVVRAAKGDTYEGTPRATFVCSFARDD